MKVNRLKLFFNEQKWFDGGEKIKESNIKM